LIRPSANEERWGGQIGLRQIHLGKEKVKRKGTEMRNRREKGKWPPILGAFFLQFQSTSRRTMVDFQSNNHHGMATEFSGQNWEQNWDQIGTKTAHFKIGFGH